MAFGTKYRLQFADYYSRAIKVDFELDGYASTVYAMTPTESSVNIQWPGERNNVFRYVRGSTATIEVRANTIGQYDEFFDAYAKQWKIKIYIDTVLFWTGWYMPGEFMQSFSEINYIVSFRAIDIGYLQDVLYPYADWDMDTPLAVLFNVLDQTGLSLSLKEAVNIYEDSMDKTAADSLLDQCEIDQMAYFDDDFTAVSCYNVLERICSAFNAIFYQDQGVWNLVRVPDMTDTHNYRIFVAGAYSSSSSETKVTTLNKTNPVIINTSGMMMSNPSWQEVNLIWDFGVKNLVPHGRFKNPDVTSITDYFTVSGGTWTFTETVTESERALWGSKNVSTVYYLTLNRTYNVEAAAEWKLRVRFKVRSTRAGGGGDITLRIGILVVVGATTYYLQEDGTWSSVSIDSLTLTDSTWEEWDIFANTFPGTGVMTVRIYMADSTITATSQSTYYDYFEVYAVKTNAVDIQNYTYNQVLSTSNLEPGDEVTMYHNDAIYSNRRDLGSHFIKLLSGDECADWQSIAGSYPANLMVISRNCYASQYSTPSRRLQAAMLTTNSYGNVLSDGTRKYIPSTLTYSMREATIQGEWIEYKTLPGSTEYVTDIDNGHPVTAEYFYDSFSGSGNTATIEKTTYDEQAWCGKNAFMTIVAGATYTVTITLTSLSASDYPKFYFAGTTISDLGEGENVRYITASGSDNYFALCHEVNTLAYFDIEISIKETLGL